MLTASLTWLLWQPAVSSVIAGATLPEQVVENVAAAAEWNPTDGVISEISAIFDAGA